MSECFIFQPCIEFPQEPEIALCLFLLLCFADNMADGGHEKPKHKKTPKNPEETPKETGKKEEKGRKKKKKNKKKGKDKDEGLTF